MLVEPDLDQVKEAHRIDAQGVELSAEGYVAARDREARTKEIQRISDATRLAAKFGLEVFVGHGLNARNIPPLLGIEGLTRLNVGYSLAARSVVVGFDAAVRELMALLESGPMPLR